MGARPVPACPASARSPRPRRRASCPGLLALGAALLLAAAPAHARGGAPKPAQVANDPYPAAFHAAVNQAVDRGVAYLLKQQAGDGSWPATKELLDHRLGHTALMTLACLSGGMTIRHPAILRALAWMRAQPLTQTYDTGILLMVLHALHAPDAESQVTQVDRYGKRKIEDPCRSKLNEADRTWMQRAVDFLLANQQGGHWRYPENGVDLSNTQYALLGLWAASRCGFAVPEQVWLDALDWLLKSQERTGRDVKLLVNEVRGEYRVAWTEPAKARGFRYIPGGSPVEGLKPVSGSMTTAGMACVAICQDELWGSRRFTPELRNLTRRSIRDALAWMQDNFDVTRNPGEPTGAWHYYYLYGMERAGVLARCRFMGAHDWYKEGADWLVAQQRSDGSWFQQDDPQLDSAFAILFLKRTTTRARNPAITPSGG